ncbi:MAG: zinc ribbon domain-containing protein [Nocardioides sp.]
MTRYADPLTCPDCRTSLPESPDSCPACGLPLRHPLASELLRTLQYADTLLVGLRATVSDPIPANDPIRVRDRVPQVPLPAPLPAVSARTGVRTTSVPKILLGLGALCLLVAAVIFLAVAWSWLGVGGRTTVLVTLTVATGAAGTWFAGRGLRVAGEALTVVALGLLTLDVIGADNAGWLGKLGLAGLVCAVGATLAAVSGALSLLPQRLLAPQLGIVAGLFTAYVGALGQAAPDRLVALLSVVAFVAVAWLARTQNLRVLPWAALAGAVVPWLHLLGSAVTAGLDTPTVRAVWSDGAGLSVLAAAGLLLTPLIFARTQPLLTLCGAGAASLATLAVVLPVVDEGLTAVTLAALATLTVWTAAAVALPSRFAFIARVPAGLAAVPVGVVATLLLTQATAQVLLTGAPFASDFGVRIDAGSTPAHPMLLVASVLALLALAATMLSPQRRTALLLPAAGTLVLSAVATIGLYDAPLWTVVGAMSLVAGALFGDALRRADHLGTVEGVAAVVVGALATAFALPSAGLVTAASIVVAAGAAATLLRGRFGAADIVGGATLPVAVGTLIWSSAEVAGIDQAFRAAPILAVLGLLALARPRVEVEATAGLVAMAAAVAGVAAANDQNTSLAVHLTLAGALVSASALVNADRRWLGWVGGALLATATWVRLADVGVDAPEAYTMPSAVALLLVGLFRLRRDPGTATALALTPGLLLGTIPSLLWVLVDPVTVRAGLLGVGCLALVLVGTRMRWNAPLVVGAAVGGLVALRELAPYAAQTPQWVMIGLAGTLLTVVGVTWERRVVELRHAASYLERLR